MVSTRNPAETIRDTISRDQRDQVFRATVDSVDGVQIAIIRIGQTVPDAQSYPAADGLAAAVAPGDEVLVVRVGRGNVVVCQIVRN